MKYFLHLEHNHVRRERERERERALDNSNLNLNVYILFCLYIQFMDDQCLFQKVIKINIPNKEISQGEYN